MNGTDGDTPSDQAPARRLIIDLVASSPPQGSVSAGTSTDHQFSGWMELLAVIESLLP